jgi:hypothetical protein
MVATSMGPWVALLVLGAVHGVNPGMGWLFAVALGLQEGSGRAVWRALPPLMLGHALAVAIAVALGVALGLVLAPATLRWIVAGCLLATGLFHLIRHRHPRFGGMRVGAKDLVIWSCLMASAHGAGLMALPFVPTGEAVAAGPTAEAVAVTADGREPAPPAAHRHGGHEGHGAHGAHVAMAGVAGGGGAGWLALLATLVHAVGYLMVTGAIAAVVYYRLGLGLLRRAWINMDRLWAGALIATAVLVVIL